MSGALLTLAVLAGLPVLGWYLTRRVACHLADRLHTYADHLQTYNANSPYPPGIRYAALLIDPRETSP